MKEIKNVVITGASSGIGLETARFLTQRGYRVFGLARTLIEDEEFESLKCDMTDYARVKQCFDEIEARAGSIDCLINNAGMGISGAMEYTSEEEIAKIFNLNLLAVINASKTILPYLRRSGGGKIINLSSVGAVIPLPFQACYSSSKAGLQTFSLALRLEVKDFGIDVSCILPGDTKTSFTSRREKSAVEVDEVYGDRIKRSVEKMEHDEQNGKPPITVSKVIYKIMKKKHSPACKTVGFSYKMIVLLTKILPTRLMLYIVKKMYG